MEKKANDKKENYEKLTSLMDAFEKKAKLLCVGDIVLDAYWYGDAVKISPEAPVPVVSVKRKQQMLGCAGNVVANLRSLGCTTHFIGLLGEDDVGDNIASLLAMAGVHAHLIRDKDRSSTTKIRIVAGHQQVVRLDTEIKKNLNEREKTALLVNVKKYINEVDCVILSDYDKGMLTPDATEEIIKIAKDAGKPVLVDPKGRDYSKYEGVYLIKPNRQELQDVSGGKNISLTSANLIQDVSVAAREVLDKYHIENMVVTLSEKGMLYVPRSPVKKEIYLPTIANEVFDVSGAGDTSIAMLAAAICCGATMEEAMTLANTAAGIVVTKVGTATVDKDEVVAMLKIRALNNRSH